MDYKYYNNCLCWKDMAGWIIMAYSLTLNSISPTSAANTGGVSLRLNFTLSGSGFSIPGFSVNLYNAASGGSLVKSLYFSDFEDPISGNAVSVNFSGVSPGSYYIEIYYKATATPRRVITITGASSAVNNIKLNATAIINNNLNANNVTKETLNGSTVYEK